NLAKTPCRAERHLTGSRLALELVKRGVVIEKRPALCRHIRRRLLDRDFERSEFPRPVTPIMLKTRLALGLLDRVQTPNLIHEASRGRRVVQALPFNQPIGEPAASARHRLSGHSIAELFQR